MIISKSENIKKFIREGGLTFIFCLLSVIILPVYVHILPLIMILWVISWILENRSRLNKEITTNNKAAVLFFLFILFFLWQVAGLFLAESLNTGFERLVKRLSFLLFPLVLFYPGSKIIKNIEFIFRLFAICTFAFLVSLLFFA